MYKNLYLKKGKEESLKRFHPWIFSGAVAQIEEGVEEGEIVRVFTSQGDFIAVGMYQIGSIAVRVLSFRYVEIDGEFWLSRCSRLGRCVRLSDSLVVRTTIRSVLFTARATTSPVS